ncbi:MAG: hypothetical protein CMA80_01565 [Euryarchaeota archaeon]|nr:hypothetical protein [Euryarchaeota archaeon]MEC8779835.1 hypothetical protein [Candidatus Thermoplasmatota archaeon]
MDQTAAVPLANGLGIVFGFLGVIAIFIQQSLTTFLPLLMPPLVCTIFCVLLFRTQPKSNDDASRQDMSPVRIDVI